MSEIKKYQFFITNPKGITASAAAKPLLDTCRTLSLLGYEDHSVIVTNRSKNVQYYIVVLLKFLKFIFTIKRGSIVATQYPLPTVGHLLYNLIRLGALRGIYFITIIHDINTLREPEFNAVEMKKELRLLNAYNGMVVHNEIMGSWLQQNGLKSSIKKVPLRFFDYISSESRIKKNASVRNNYEIAFAGHLEKSLFVYELDYVNKWKFNVYGSDFNAARNKNINTIWKGEFSPDEIVYNLDGSFGLVWDGSDSKNIETNRFGNYMRYNNPFKFSLYLAAGLPVIAPESAAIAVTIKKYNIGFLIKTLDDLNNIQISDEEYAVMKQNVAVIQRDIIRGNYLKTAVQKLEQALKAEA